MRKISILMTIFSISSFLSFAQVNSTTGNGLNAAKDGYVLEFKGENYNPLNCPAKMPYNQYNLPDTWATYTAENDSLTISTNGKQTGDNAFWIRLFDVNCNDASVNLKDNQKLKIKIRSSVDVPQFMVMLGDVYGNFASQNPAVISLKKGDNILDVSDLDFRIYNSTDKIDSTDIALMSFRFRYSWSDGYPADGGVTTSIIGTFKISSVELGNVQTTTGMNISAIESSLKYYPNPVNNQLTVSFEAKENSIVTISDVTGKVLKTVDYSLGNSALNINTSDLINGMYLLSIRSKEGVVSKLFTVNK